MTELRQSTAVTIKLGPFVDSSDGDTLEEGLAGSMTVKLSKNGGDIAARHSTDAITYDESGFYNVPLDATDTNTLGRLRILVVNAGTHLPVWADFMVVRQAYWDWKYGSADLAVDATKISGSATAADAVEANIGNLDEASSTLLAGIYNLGVASASVAKVADGRTITSGTESGDYEDTYALDEAYHVITADGGEIDYYYEFTLGDDSVPVAAHAKGRLHEGSTPGGGDSVDIYVYDWTTSAWELMTPPAGGFVGVANSDSSKDVVRLIPLFQRHKDSSTNKVRVRFVGASLETNTALYVDQIYLTYTSMLSYSGIANAILANPSNKLETDSDGRALADAVKISGSATAADSLEANIGNLDVAVSTRAPASTALSKNTWTDERAGKLDYLDANVSSRASAEYYTSTRAAYLDHLNVGGLVASHADIQGITQASRIRIATSPQWERPDDGSTTYRIWVYHYNEQHQPEDLDSNPTVTVENEQGTDRSGNLGTVTKESGTTGVYYVDYTVADDHAVEGLIIKVSATENGETGVWAIGASVVDTTAVDFTSSDRQKLEAIKAQTDKLGFSDSNDVKATLDGEQVNLAADQEVNVTKWAGTSVSVGAASNLPSVSADAISDSAASADAVEANIANLDDKVSDITAQTSKLQFTAEGDVKATLDGEEVTTASLSTQAQNQVNQACDQALSDYNPAKPEDVEITVP